MMKKRNLVSAITAVLLMFAVLLGILITGVNAEEVTVLYTVGDMGVNGAVVVSDFSEALAAIDAKNNEWESDDSVEIRFSGTILGGAENGLLFGQTTVFRSDKTKLPITLRGVDTATQRDATIFLDPIGGYYACANDYKFVNLTLPVGEQTTQFYAGSGEISFENVSFTSGAGVKIPDRAAQLGMHSFTQRATEMIVNDTEGNILPDVKSVPAGDAWENVRLRDETIGQGLNGTPANYYGDYVHDGDIGGGQYINGCVYFEVLTGISCIGNTWEPNYNLPLETRQLLQEEAHKAVVATYGEDHFKNRRTDILGNDGVINLLILGSSNNAYLREEVYGIAKAAGVEIRVCHAYSSGILLNAQWSWVQNGNGAYTFYTTYNGTTTSASNQKITDVLPLYNWDAIVTYQSSNGFVDFGFDEAGWTNFWKTCEKADDFYNWIYNWNNGALRSAEYYWYEITAYPLGAPGPASGFEGKVFADNCTDAAFSGWTAEHIAKAKELGGGKIVSSITLGDGCVLTSGLAGKGYITERPTQRHLTDDEARAVKFLTSAGYENIPDIRPIDTHAKLILDGASADRLFAVKGYSPAEVTLHIKKGGASTIGTHDAYQLTSVPYIYGNVTMKVSGGGITKEIDALTSCHVKGNVTLDISSDDAKTTVGKYVRMGSSTHSVEGDIVLSIRDVDVSDSVLAGGAATGTCYTTIKNSNISGFFYGIRNGNGKHVVNTFENVHLTGNYFGGNYFDNSIGPIENYIKNVTVDGNWYGGNYNVNQTGSLGVISGKIMVDGVERELAVYNKVDGLTADNVCAGSKCGIINGGIYNDAKNINTATYEGGTAWGTIKGDVTNIIKDSNITTFCGAGNAPAADLLVQGNVYNTLTGGTYDVVTGVVVGSAKTTTVNKDVTNIIEGGIRINKIFSGIASTDGSYVNQTVKGNVTNRIRKAGGAEPVFKGGSGFAFYGAGHHGVAMKGVVNYIEAGVFDNTFVGLAFRVSSGKTVGKVTLSGYEDYSVVNIVSGGTFNAGYHGGLIGSGGTLSGGICNIISGGTFPSYYNGGSRGIALGESSPVKNLISGGKFNSTVYLASRVNDPYSQTQGLVAKAESIISGGEFSQSVYAACRDGGNVTSCTLTINGGVFNNVYAGSEALTENGTVTDRFQTTDVTLTIHPTTADVVLNKVISSRGENETVCLKGGEKKIILGKAGGLLATEYDGAAQIVQQNNSWDLDVTYLQVPADKAAGITTVKKDNTVTGFVFGFAEGEYTVFKGFSGTRVVAANLILDDKVGVRLWIRKDMADAVGEELSFTVTRSDLDTPVYTGTYAQLVAGGVKDFDGTPCYTIVLPGTAPSAFHVAFDVAGTGMEDFAGSINDILAIAIANEGGDFGADFVNVCKALWNYGIEAYDRFSGQTSSLNRETVEGNTADILNIVNNDGDKSAFVAGKSLVLREAVGIKIYGLVNASLENFKVRVNGVELSQDQFEMKAESGSAEYNMSITVFVKLPSMADQFTVSIYNGESFACSVTESIASCCQQYVNAGSKDAALCASILSLIKAIPEVNA